MSKITILLDILEDKKIINRNERVRVERAEKL